ncbi:HelD family protein [Trujillonella endophytica]|uniref:DNA helicase IV n=1 Tax=Trujillonella endophytica TaxID=673521 RepID=A0A1H8VKB6_9ACTN|nr:ATP-binding domain-containing protein [Trujillella endophytica]SEP15851.1 DNA helicase IV [Trujillella endophytica]
MPTTRSERAVAPPAADTQLALEQEYVTDLYARLDAARDLAARRLRQAITSPAVSPQDLQERDATVRFQSERVTALDAAEAGLVVGRIDRVTDGALYVGRIGLAADDARTDPALVDWRAPAARPFYTATPMHPLGVVRRRHIRTRGRTVVRLDDEVIDALTAADADGLQITGEAALLAALGASRTGRMTDIVRTIQAEQDRIIRADAGGVLVVQGGPGTGKTAVALHRAAYLLYTHRERLARRGLLVVGPTPTFLRYIADVLPSLGETGVLLSGLGQLRPGVDARAEEAPEAAALKGRLEMAEVLERAVAARQVVPDAPVTVLVDGTPVRLRPVDVARVRTSARKAARLHNPGRPEFARRLVDLLAKRYADALGAGIDGGRDLFGRDDVAALRREVGGEPEVRALVQRLWPRLTAERFLREFLADPAAIAEATPGWSAADRARLHRPDGAWTVADVPLLEEADELLGSDDSAERGRAGRDHRRRLAEAQATLDLLHGSRSTDLEDGEDGEVLSAGDLLTAERLADRQRELDLRTTAERAAADRTWTFGHVVVDEAQELSPMAWRLLARRCPTRSMTVVGDVAQTGTLAGADRWAEVLDPHAAGLWRLEELTVNYRTPAEIMAVAADVLAAGGTGLTPPRSVREGGEPPEAETTGEEHLVGRVVERVVDWTAHEGTLAVVVPPSRAAAVADALSAKLAGITSGPEADSARGPVVLTPTEAKGLEFDSVLVVDPQGVLDEGVRGRNDLYVALTRATQRLAVLAPGALPAELSRLA